MADKKELIQDLEAAFREAINKGLEEGGAIRETLAKIIAEGYEVAVILDTQIGLDAAEAPQKMQSGYEFHPGITPSDREEMRKLGFDPALRPPKEEDGS